MHDEVRALIDHFDLQPLPVEGTLFASTHRSPAELPGGGPVGTAIIGLYCNEPESWSCFHRMPEDEIWHFYAGDPLRLVLLHPDGSSEDVILGPEPWRGQHVQFRVSGGVWQAGHVVDGGRYSLFGCTMAPGFTDSMFEAAHPETLVAGYPDRAADIERLSVRGDELHMPAGFAT